MKKKIALVLAGVMSVSALPMNLFAATIGASNTSLNLPGKTLLFESGMFVDSSGNRVVNPVADSTDNDVIDYAVDGTDLVLTMDSDVVAGSTFQLTLNNAKWFFKSTTPVTGWNAVANTSLVWTSTTSVAAPAPTTQLTNSGTVVSLTADASIYGATGSTEQSVLDAATPDVARAIQRSKIGMNLIYVAGGGYKFALNNAKENGVFTLSDAKGDFLQLDPAKTVSKMGYGDNDKDSNTSWDYYAQYKGIATSNVGQFSSTYDTTKGVFFEGDYSVEATGTYYRYPVNAKAFDAAGTRTEPTGVAREIPYSMNIDYSGGGITADVKVLPLRNANGEIAQSVYPARIGGGNVNPYVIRIPMVVRTTANADISVKITKSTIAGVSGEPIVYLGTATAGGTTTTVVTPQSARDVLAIDRLLIKENRIRSIAGGGILQITAPAGYTFNNPTSKLRLGLDSGLAWNDLAGTRTSYQGFGIAGTDFYATYKRAYLNGTTAGDADLSTIYVFIPANKIARSSALPGNMFIEGLEIYPDASTPFAPVNITVSTISNDAISSGNYGYNLYNVNQSLIAAYGGLASSGLLPTGTSGYALGITTATVLAGTRTDWTLGVTAGTLPAALVSGRYVSDTEFGADDSNHKAARVTMTENAVYSWWSGRETQLTLSKEAKFRRVRFTTADNFVSQNIVDLDFPADGKRNPNVTVSSNSITLYNLAIKTDKKAVVAFDSWLSVEPGFSGDITLTVANASASTVTNTGAIPVTIAKAVSPVTVKADVTEVKVGYQTYKTADVTITETAPGMLQRGKKVLVSVSDLITQDLYFAPINPASDVVLDKDSQLAVRNITTVNTDGNGGVFGATNNSGSLLMGGGTISMEIDRASSTKAASITIKNLNVKVNRSVPQSTVDYQIIVWGSAVAENYGPNRDEFTKPGIMAANPYVKVVSSATDKTSVLTQEVRVTIGDDYYVVNGTTQAMDAKAYISTKSNSTMVPIRFVAYAFGITKEQILYDDTTKTVTIIHPTRIVQFTKDSNKMMLNGAPVTMMSPDGLPVACENTDDYLYIPMRALGDAFGVQTDWEDATKTAIYNKGGSVTPGTVAPVVPAK